MSTTLVGRGFDQYFEQSDFTLGLDSSLKREREKCNTTLQIVSHFFSSGAMGENDKLLAAFISNSSGLIFQWILFSSFSFQRCIAPKGKYVIIYRFGHVLLCLLPHLAMKYLALCFHSTGTRLLGMQSEITSERVQMGIWNLGWAYSKSKRCVECSSLSQ